ncbi:MAG: DUF1203 domain-containing protein [Erythrobacter sp.]|nr:DUF1203 domain-containing protein [Erythrobacter sp.]NCQ63740.1 DUF1203 domain-containing protein [Alphaproteobacteria bacterium]
MPYRITGLDPAPFAALFGADEAVLAARGVLRMKADRDTGFPCRITLADAPAGTPLLLLNHLSRTDDGPYRASHAIFVREDAREAAAYEGRIAPVMERRILSLRGFDGTGLMVDALLAQPGEGDAGLRKLLDNPTIAEVDAHTATRGCFLARARRA